MLEYLEAQHWRGNVRELNNKIHRGVILAQEDGLLKLITLKIPFLPA